MQRPHTPPAHVYLATPASDSPAPAITEVHLPARRPAPGTRVRTPRVPGGNGRSHSPQDPVLNAGPRPWTPTVSSIALTPTPPPHLRLSAGSSNGGSLQRTGRPIPLVVPGRGRSASNVSASGMPRRPSAMFAGPRPRATSNASVMVRAIPEPPFTETVVISALARARAGSDASASGSRPYLRGVLYPKPVTPTTSRFSSLTGTTLTPRTAKDSRTQRFRHVTAQTYLRRAAIAVAASALISYMIALSVSLLTAINGYAVVPGDLPESVTHTVAGVCAASALGLLAAIGAIVATARYARAVLVLCGLMPAAMAVSLSIWLLVTDGISAAGSVMAWPDRAGSLDTIAAMVVTWPPGDPRVAEAAKQLQCTRATDGSLGEACVRALAAAVHGNLVLQVAALATATGLSALGLLVWSAWWWASRTSRTRCHRVDADALELV